MNRLRNDKCFAVAAGVLSVVVFFLVPALQAATFQLPQGTDVKVKFTGDKNITSGNVAKGDSLGIVLAEPISIGDQLLIAEGAPGKAVVTEVKKASAPGKPGQIKVAFAWLGTRGGFKTADGSAIRLAGTVDNKGKGKKLLAYVTIVGIFLIKGGQGRIPIDSMYNAKIGQTVVLTGE
jgi:hypothetical protein